MVGYFFELFIYFVFIIINGIFNCLILYIFLEWIKLLLLIDFFFNSCDRREEGKIKGVIFIFRL